MRIEPHLAGAGRHYLGEEPYYRLSLLKRINDPKKTETAVGLCKEVESLPVAKTPAKLNGAPPVDFVFTGVQKDGGLSEVTIKMRAGAIPW